MNQKRRHYIHQYGLIFIGIVLWTAAGAQQMRSLAPINTPEALPDDAHVVEQTVPVPRAEMNDAVQEIAQDWSRGEMGQHMAEGFHQKDRYLESMNFNVPKNTRMQVESTQGVSTLNQYVRTGTSGRRERVSTVAATLNTRLMVNDPSTGFLGVPGSNEVIFEVVEILE